MSSVRQITSSPFVATEHNMCILQMDLSTFEQQELSNVIWAYGKMKYCNNEELMRRSSVEMLRRGLDRFVPQAISNVCWAYAKHDLVYDEFLQVSIFHTGQLFWLQTQMANVIDWCLSVSLHAVSAPKQMRMLDSPAYPSYILYVVIPMFTLK